MAGPALSEAGQGARNQKRLRVAMQDSLPCGGCSYMLQSIFISDLESLADRAHERCKGGGMLVGSKQYHVPVQVVALAHLCPTKSCQIPAPDAFVTADEGDRRAVVLRLLASSLCIVPQ